MLLMDFPILLDQTSRVPIFPQLSRALRERVMTGQLAAGVNRLSDLLARL